MQSLWISLRDNVKCGSKLSDTIIQPEKCSRRRCNNRKKENLHTELIHHVRRTSFQEVTIKQCHKPTQFCDLGVGDPARNITEMIFQRASKNPLRKIKKVLRVKNPIEILEKFERYREKVKTNAYEQHKRHPRSIVDGNEVLRFYGTATSCYGERSTPVSELCRDPSCRVCRIIQSNFDTEYAKKNGIRLSTSSEELSDNVIIFSNVKKIERAVIVCRAIAGAYEECASTPSGSESLIVRNPSAVLPCFVIIFT